MRRACDRSCAIILCYVILSVLGTNREEVFFFFMWEERKGGDICLEKKQFSSTIFCFIQIHNKYMLEYSIL